MSATAEFNVRSTIETTVPYVFETMLGFVASLDPNKGHLVESDRVSGTIGIGGETLTGAIYIHLPEVLAIQLVNAMLGNPATQPVSDGDLNDVVGELANMIGGSFKSALCDADRPCAMSTPSIIRGAYVVEAPQDSHAEIFHFLCQGQRLVVEIHLKLD